MVSTFTPNIQLEEPARGDQVGTWDTPVNNNSTLLDLVSGGNTTINISAGNTTLSAAQFQCSTITCNSTLLSDTTLTFPTSFKKPYSVYNTATGSSQFTVILKTTASGGEQIAVPPGQFTGVYNDGTNIRFTSLPHLGSYWDYAGSSVPRWVSNCTVPPWVNCDGSAISSATYPQLAALIGTTLPDFRGRLPAYLNQTTGRLTSAGAGIDGNTNFASGGNNGVMLSTSQVPVMTSSISVTPYAGATPLGSGQVPFGAGSGWAGVSFGGGASFNVPQTGATVQNSDNFRGTVTLGASTQSIIQATVPVEVGGLRLIRAA